MRLFDLTRRRFLRRIAIAGCAATLAPWPRETGATDSSASGLDALLRPIQTEYGLPGLGAAFARSSGLIAQAAIGARVRNGSDKIETDDLFHLGSCTKSMTATLIGTFVEEGKVSWETTIAEALPNLGRDIPSEYHSVTLAHLLTHSAGLPGKVSPNAYRRLELRYRQLDGSLHEQRLEMSRRALSEPPLSEPGTEFSYSNLGYIIAGAMLEALTGKLWEDLMRERLFSPLGMTSAGFGAPGKPGQVNQPRGHTASECKPIEPGPIADNASVVGPAGTVHASMTDWTKYAIQHLRGARGESGLLLQRETFHAMHRDRDDLGYGLGWDVTERDWAAGTALTHAGSNTLWYAVIWIAPERDAAFLAAANWGSKQAFQAIDSAVAAMIGRYL